MEQRKEKIKMKVFLTQEMNKQNQQQSQGQNSSTAPTPTLTSTDLSQLSDAEQALRILQIHNMKTDKIIHGYHAYCSLRIKAKEKGVSFEELKA